MGKVALIVEFEIKPGNREAFLAHLRAHAADTLAGVPGCLQFEVMVPREVQFDVLERTPDHNRVFLYEVYADDATLEAHLQSPRVAKTRAGYADIVETRRITRCSLD